jgi:hypothetical protein
MGEGQGQGKQPASNAPSPFPTSPGSVPVATPAAVTGTGEDASRPDVAAAKGVRRHGAGRRRAGILAGIAFLVLVGGFFAGPTVWGIWHERDHRIVIPGHVAGLALDDNPVTHDTVDQLRGTVQANVPLESTTGAIYVDESGASRSVLFVGGTGALASAEVSLDKALKAVGEDAGGIDNTRRVPPGPLGGVMKCGVTGAGPGVTAVCGWAEHGSLGVAVFTNQNPDSSAGLLRKMREAMQRPA